MSTNGQNRNLPLQPSNPWARAMISLEARLRAGSVVRARQACGRIYDIKERCSAYKTKVVREHLFFFFCFADTYAVTLQYGTLTIKFPEGKPISETKSGPRSWRQHLLPMHGLSQTDRQGVSKLPELTENPEPRLEP